MATNEDAIQAAYDHFAATTAVLGDAVAFRSGFLAGRTWERAVRAFDAACEDYARRTGANAGDMPLALEDFLPPEWRQ